MLPGTKKIHRFSFIAYLIVAGSVIFIWIGADFVIYELYGSDQASEDQGDDDMIIKVAPLWAGNVKNFVAFTMVN